MKWKQQDGSILPVTLLVLASVLLWGSIQLLSLSDQYAASSDLIRQEQSRLLAQSGWNLALQQLETEGSVESILLEPKAGTVQVEMTTLESNRIQIRSDAESGGYSNHIQGIVRILTVPWLETRQWQVAENGETLSMESWLYTEEDTIVLPNLVQQSLAIGAQCGQPIQVIVREPVSCKKLYVDGDLRVEAALKAESICVSGSIVGAEQIACERIREGYTEEPGYRLLLEERNL